MGEIGISDGGNTSRCEEQGSGGTNDEGERDDDSAKGDATESG